MRRILAAISTCAVWLVTTSCVSPIYNTAEVTKGKLSFNIGAGPSIVTEKYYVLKDNQYTQWDTTVALRFDFQPIWGISERKALLANLGMSVPVKQTETMSFKRFFYPSIKIGLQYEIIEHPSIAMRFDVGYPFPFTFSLLGDIYVSKLNREIATLGVNLSLDGPLGSGPQGWSRFPLAPSLFINTRPFRRFSIYTGVTFYPPVGDSWNDYEYFECSLGLGYKFF